MVLVSTGVTMELLVLLPWLLLSLRLLLRTRLFLVYTIIWNYKTADEQQHNNDSHNQNHVRSQSHNRDAYKQWEALAATGDFPLTLPENANRDPRRILN